MQCGGASFLECPFPVQIYSYHILFFSRYSCPSSSVRVGYGVEHAASVTSLHVQKQLSLLSCMMDNHCNGVSGDMQDAHFQWMCPTHMPWPVTVGLTGVYFTCCRVNSCNHSSNCSCICSKNNFDSRTVGSNCSCELKNKNKNILPNKLLDRLVLIMQWEFTLNI